MLMNKIFKISSIFEETPDVRTLRFNLDKPMDYKPGQFLMIGKDINYNSEIKKIKRAFSISTSPTTRNYFEITVKKEKNGLFTPVIFQLNEGDELEVSGPFGMFVYQRELEDKYTEIVLIAGGTGIAPLRSILNYVLDNNIKIKVNLLYSVRTPESIIYKKEIQEIKKKHNNFSSVITVTRPDESNEEWEGQKGRITKELINEIVDELEKAVFFICGPTQMVEDLIRSLKELNARTDQIKIEKW
ncbi:hypothetical protein J4214_04165 [Candidatus Woesearchaeota archaeon]|nr:hypothetical protein [Candidatus Woesearchaeota archaeon]